MKAKAAAGDLESDNKLKRKAKSTSANAPKQQQPPPKKKARKTCVVDSDEEGDQADSYEQLRAQRESDQPVSFTMQIFTR